MNLSNKRVRFGELHVREFDLATMGEHPKAKGGFALQLGQRYQDLPPVAIPDKEQMHGVKRRKRRVRAPQRKELWIEQWQLEQALLNGRRILGGGKKDSTDEQRWFERQGRTQKPLLEHTMDEQRFFERQAPLERLSKQQQPPSTQRAGNELEWNRRRTRLIHEWRIDQALIDRRLYHCRQVARNERKRLRREMREKMERRRLRREMRENERRLAVLEPVKRQPAEKERPEQEPRMDELGFFLWIALDVAFASVLMILFLVVSSLLDTVFRLSICKDCLATLSVNGYTHQYRENLSFCVRCCKREEYCACVCGIVALFLCIREFVACVACC
jgi:hypothetical protein